MASARAPVTTSLAELIAEEGAAARRVRSLQHQLAVAKAHLTLLRERRRSAVAARGDALLGTLRQTWSAAWGMPEYAGAVPDAAAVAAAAAVDKTTQQEPSVMMMLIFRALCWTL